RGCWVSPPWTRTFARPQHGRSWLPSTVLCSVDRPAFRLAEAVALGDGVSAPRAGAVLGAERRYLGALASVCRLPGQRHVHRWRRKRALSPLVKAKPEIVAMGGDAVSAWRCGMAVCDDCAGFRTVLRVRRRCGRGHVHRWRRKRALSPLVKAKPEIVAMGESGRASCGERREVCDDSAGC